MGERASPKRRQGVSELQLRRRPVFVESRFGEEPDRRRLEPGKSGRCRSRVELAILEAGSIQGTGSAGREKEQKVGA